MGLRLHWQQDGTARAGRHGPSLLVYAVADQDAHDPIRDQGASLRRGLCASGLKKRTASLERPAALLLSRVPGSSAWDAASAAASVAPACSPPSVAAPCS